MSRPSQHSVPPPPNHLGLALLGVLMFFPLGIPAFLKSLQVPRLWRAGSHTEALQAASAAKVRAVWAIVLFVVALAALAVWTWVVPHVR